MRLDYESSLFESAVDSMVEILLPRMSCSPIRWLTFELNVVLRDGSTFPYSLRYRAMSNYTDWQVFLPQEGTHYKMSGDKFGPSRWVRVVPNGEKTAVVYDQDNGEKVREWAPGFVIADGCHDSCWRGNAVKLSGRPYQGEHRERTHYLPNDQPIEEVQVIRVGLEGRMSARWLKEHPELLPDDEVEWVNGNPTDLTGAWAIYTALAELVDTARMLPRYTVVPADHAERLMASRGGQLDGCEPLEGPPNFKPFYDKMEIYEWTEERPLWFRIVNMSEFIVLCRVEALTHYDVPEPLELNLDTSMHYYKHGEEEGQYKRTSERRETIGYRFGPEGRLFATRRVTRSIFDDDEWNDNEGHATINRESHLRQMGVSKKKLDEGLVGISHMWPR